MRKLEILLAKGKSALAYGAIGLASLLPVKEVKGQDVDNPNTLNPFFQPNIEQIREWNYLDTKNDKDNILKIDL